MRLENLRKFVCPDDGAQINVHGYGTDEKGNILLYGECSQCGDVTVVNVDKLFVGAYSKEKGN